MMSTATEDRTNTICDAAAAEPLRVDVRSPAEYREMHIAGSWNVPLPDLESQLPKLRELCGERPILLVCRSGQRAQKAQAQLSAAGLTNLQCLEGGLSRYVEQGGQVERGKAAMSIERQTRIAAGSLVVLGTLLGYFLHPGFLAISGFVGAGLVFAGVTDTCGMGLLLARMPWNRGCGSQCPV